MSMMPTPEQLDSMGLTHTAVLGEGHQVHGTEAAIGYLKGTMEKWASDMGTGVERITQTQAALQLNKDNMTPGAFAAIRDALKGR